jgi:hypothetical protein
MKHQDYKIREKLAKMQMNKYKKKLLKKLERSDNNAEKLL